MALMSLLEAGLSSHEGSVPIKKAMVLTLIGVLASQVLRSARILLVSVTPTLGEPSVNK